MKASSVYRAEARQALEGRWLEAALAMLVFFLLVVAANGGSSLSSIFNGVETFKLIGITLLGTSVSMIGTFFVVMPLTVGQEAVYLEVIRGKQEKIMQRMFSIGYGNLGRAIVFVLLISLIVVAITIVWVFFLAIVVVAGGWDVSSLDADLPGLLVLVTLLSMVFYVWAIVYVGYRYGMTSFLILDKPELSGVECMRESRRLMKGKCWKLFCLDFSFIGWLLLCIFFIPLFFVGPYQQAAHAAFYLDLIKDEAKTEDESLITVEITVEVDKDAEPNVDAEASDFEKI